MAITFPTNTVETIDAIRGAIDRQVTFYIPTLTGCDTCTLNPVKNTSTDPFCSGCDGDYWITTYSGVTLSGHVTWGKADNLNWQTGGELFDGDCRVQVKLQSNTLSIVDSADYVIVDDKTLEVKTKILRGVPTLNRVLLDCIERYFQYRLWSYNKKYHTSSAPEHPSKILLETHSRRSQNGRK